MTAKRTPRGIRNHNPGNIEYRPKTQWQGQIGTDGRFVIFSAPEYGIRAIIKILQNYQRKHGLKSLSAMLQRWAPPHENHTNSYIAFVAQSLDVSPDEALDLNDAKVAVGLVRAIIAQENGYAYRNYYPSETIAKGLALAGINTDQAIQPANQTEDKSAKSGKIKYPRTTATAAASTATAAGAGLAIEQINSSLEGLQQLGASGALLMSRLADAKLWLWLVIAAALAVGIYVAYSKYREVRK